jgi:hypothetical protein
MEQGDEGIPYATHLKKISNLALPRDVLREWAW